MLDGFLSPLQLAPDQSGIGHDPVSGICVSIGRSIPGGLRQSTAFAGIFNRFNPCEGFKPSQGLVGRDSVNILLTAAQDNRIDCVSTALRFGGSISRDGGEPGGREGGF
jgi:hypothetical protein